MKHKFGIFISISAVSVFSFLAIARNTPAHKPVGSAQLEALERNARVAEGPMLSQQEAQNADLAIPSTPEEKRLIGDFTVDAQRSMTVDNQLTIGPSYSAPSAPSAPTALRVINE